MDTEKLIDGWVKHIYDKVDKIDPTGDLCWTTLFIGFAIGYTDGKISAAEAMKIFDGPIYERGLY